MTMLAETTSTHRVLHTLCSHLQPSAATIRVDAVPAAGAAKIPLAANGVPRLGNADRSTMGRSGGAHGGPLEPKLEFCSIFQGATESAPFSSGSPFAFVHAAVIPPGGGIGLHTHHDCEEIFVTIDNASQFTHNERTTQVECGAAVPCRARECHGIYNHTQAETRWFNFNVALAREPTHGQRADATDLGEAGTPRATRVGVPLVAPDQLPIGRFDRSLLEPFSNAHGGKGEIFFRMIWGPRDFKSNLSHLHHLLLPPNTSLGYFKRESIEEVFVIMSGTGRMTVADQTFPVKQYDVVFCGVGEGRGVFNDSGGDLEIFKVGVTLLRNEDQDPTNPKLDNITDLGDDLTSR